MPYHTTSLPRRSLVALGSALMFGSLSKRGLAHNGEDHGGSTPVPSPVASPEPSMMNTGTGAAYMHIANSGDVADRLITVSTEVAKIAEIHEMTMTDGVMKMAELKEGLEIPPHGEVTLGPDGYHIMLINLTRSLESGTTFALDLTFDRAGTQAVIVTVGSEAPDDADPVETGDLTIRAVWARPAPMITVGTEVKPDATPNGSPAS